MPKGSLGGAVPQRRGAKGLGDPRTSVQAVRGGLRVCPAARTARGFGREAIRNPGGGPAATDGSQAQGRSFVGVPVGSEALEEQGQGTGIGTLAEPCAV